ncbi:MAG: family 10 glycosylhydrolase, partial [Bacteroidota bacterium]
AHRVGLEVHPWLEYGFAASFEDDGGPILKARPGWAGKRLSTGDARADDGFYWMSQANPEVQDFLITLGLELALLYDIDGVQLDRIRYGNVHQNGSCCTTTDFGYDDAHIAAFRADQGTDPPSTTRNGAWMQWRTRLLDAFHQRFYDEIKSAVPHVTISNAPIVFPYGYNNFLQTWPNWAGARSADFLMPQLYRFDRGSFNREVGSARADSRGFDGLIAGTLVKSGTYLAEEALVADFVEATRDADYAGTSIWFYEGTKQLGAVWRDVFAEPAAVPKRPENWRPPALVIQDAEAVQTGTWTTVEGEGSAGLFSSNNQVLTARGGSGATLTYQADVPVAAVYDAYAYQVAGREVTERAPVRFVPDGSNTFLNLTNVATRGYTYLGTAFLDAGVQDIAEFMTQGVPSTLLVAADAVMLKLNRGQSPDAVVPTSTARADVPAAPALVRLYPNPASNSARFEHPLREPALVFDVLGRLIERMEPGTTAIDVQDWPAGVYFVRTASSTSRLVVR